MAFFYFDESIHASAGFIVGAWVAWQQDPTLRINQMLHAAGLRPGFDEFKSGARMAGNEPMQRARENLRETLRDCRIGVVIVPSSRRSDVGREAIRALQKILVTANLGISGHEVFIDQGLVGDRVIFEAVVKDLSLAGLSLHIEQDSIIIPGLQAADLIAHTCATMLLSEMGLVKKRVRAGDDSGYDPHDELDLAFMLWASVRWNFFADPPPPPDQWESQLDFQVDVEHSGLFIASSASDELRAAARERFGST